MNKWQKITVRILLLAVTLFFIIPVTVDAAGQVKQSTSKKNTIPDGITIEGTDVSNMTKAQAQKVVDGYLAKYSTKKITLTANGKTIVAKSKNLGITTENTEIVREALHYGKEGNFLERYKAAEDLKQGKGKNFEIQLTADPATVAKYLTDNESQLNTPAVNNGLTRTNGAFQFVKGSEGTVLDVKKSAQAVQKYIKEEWDGTDAKIALVTKVQKPQGTEKELSEIKDVLGSFHTDYSTSTAARKQNVQNGASKINGTILYPGETFSVAAALNPMTAENGYAQAPSYENGTTVETYGGGICQVSTTLYNAVMRAELEIVKRSSHSMVVHYVDPSMDAAIAGTAKDFQFKNNQKYPVYLEGYTTGGTIYFNVYGKETRDANRSVTFQSEVTSQTDPVTQFVASSENPVGYIAKTQDAHTGYTARLWKIVTVNGAEESRKVYNNSKYKASNTVYTVGVQSQDPTITAAINAAIATQDEATIRAAAAQGAAAQAQLAAQQAAQQAAQPAAATPAAPQ